MNYVLIAFGIFFIAIGVAIVNEALSQNASN